MGFPKGIDKVTIKTVLEYAYHFSFEEHLTNILSIEKAQIPMMMIYTKNDPLIETSIFEEVCTFLPPALTCVYTDGGHNPQRKHCEEISSNIELFITQTDNGCD